MYEVVWKHKQSIDGYGNNRYRASNFGKFDMSFVYRSLVADARYITVLYDSDLDKAKVMDVCNDELPSFSHTDEIDSFYAKLSMSCKYLGITDSLNEYSGVEFFRNNGVVLYAGISQIGSPYLIMRIDELVTAVHGENIGCFSYDYSFRVNVGGKDVCYIVIFCSMEALMLMSRSSSFREALFGRLRYTGVVNERQCCISPLEGIVYE